MGSRCPAGARAVHPGRADASAPDRLVGDEARPDRSTLWFGLAALALIGIGAHEAASGPWTLLALPGAIIATFALLRAAVVGPDSAFFVHMQRQRRRDRPRVRCRDACLAGVRRGAHRVRRRPRGGRGCASRPVCRCRSQGGRVRWRPLRRRAAVRVRRGGQGRALFARRDGLHRRHRRAGVLGSVRCHRRRRRPHGDFGPECGPQLFGRRSGSSRPARDAGPEWANRRDLRSRSRARTPRPGRRSPESLLGARRRSGQPRASASIAASALAWPR